MFRPDFLSLVAYTYLLKHTLQIPNRLAKCSVNKMLLIVYSLNVLSFSTVKNSVNPMSVCYYIV